MDFTNKYQTAFSVQRGYAYMLQLFFYEGGSPLESTAGG